MQLMMNTAFAPTPLSTPAPTVRPAGIPFAHPFPSPADLRIPRSELGKVWVDPEAIFGKSETPDLAPALPRAQVEKMTKGATGFKDALRIDAIARSFGDGLKGLNYWFSNLARFNNGEAQAGTTDQLWNAESGFASRFLPSTYRTPSLSSEQASRLIDMGGAVGSGNNVIKSVFYLLNIRKLNASLEATKNSNHHDTVSHKNTLAKLAAERLRVFSFLFEKGFNLASWAAVSASLGLGLGWEFGALMLIGGHATNLLGLSAQMISAVKALGEENHVYARQQMLNPLLSPERVAKKLGEKISAHHDSDEATKAEVKHLLAAMKTDTVEEMVVAVTAHKNEIDAASTQNLWGKTVSFLKSFWNRDTRRVDGNTVSGEAVLSLRKQLTVKTAARIQRLMQLELELTGETSLPSLEKEEPNASITEATELPSIATIAAHLENLETPTARKGRVGAENTASLVRAFEVPGKMALSVAALYYAAKAVLPHVNNTDMVGETALVGASEATQVDVFNILSGAHTIPNWLTASVMAATLIGPGLAFCDEVRELRKAAGDFVNGNQNSADNVYYYSVGAATSAIIASGAALSASPVTRPYGMLIGASGMGAMVLGKFLFYKYKHWASYKAIRDIFANIASPIINAIFNKPFQARQKPETLNNTDNITITS